MDTLFFIAAKLVWALIRPETWLLLLVVGTFLALIWKRHRLATWCAGLTLALIAFLGILPIGAFLLSGLENRYPANPPLDQVAGLLVLGGGESTTLSAHWGQVQTNEAGDRFIAALALARAYADAPVLFTGGIGQLDQEGPAGADIAEELFLSAGLTENRLILERASRNTAENARNTLDLRDPDRSGSWVLVTSAFHMPRAVETFCAAGWTDLLPWPTDYRGTGRVNDVGWDLVGGVATFNLALKEHVGRFAYRLTGRADPDRLEGCLAGGG